jgi:hypothetical protein
MRGGRTSITTSQFSVLPSRPRMIDPERVGHHRAIEVGGRRLSMLVELKDPQHDRVAEHGSNHGRCSGEGTDGSRNAMGGWPVTVEIAFAATLS